MVKRTFTKEIKLTPVELAECFCDMSSEEQAQFFNELHAITRQWPVGIAFQLQNVTDEECLTLEGRTIMRQIGEYARKI